MDELCSKGTMVGRRLDNIWYFPDTEYLRDTVYNTIDRPLLHVVLRSQKCEYMFFFRNNISSTQYTVLKLNIIMIGTVVSYLDIYLQE